MSAKAEYAVRAMVQLATAASGTVVKTDDLAAAQGIPPQFLVDILTNLRTDRLVRSHRGREGGYELARPGTEISIADVLRCIDGPLASVRDIGLGDLPYSGPTTALTDVWRALRASMRSVLEETTLADVAGGALPEHVARSPTTTRRRARGTAPRAMVTSRQSHRQGLPEPGATEGVNEWSAHMRLSRGRRCRRWRCASMATRNCIG
ncbi:BadM/Rrf2 family transcriptional regulator [Mycobacterium tuberculosis EAI5/NITR206]|nr:BadM/Rrf2 family transcriptional regulator [Mycobacterium tuberculosis EAI5/NITR206]